MCEVKQEVPAPHIRTGNGRVFSHSGEWVAHYFCPHTHCIKRIEGRGPNDRTAVTQYRQNFREHLQRDHNGRLPATAG